MRLGDVATFINGYAFKPSDYSETGRPIIRIQNLTGNAYETNAFDGEIDDKYLIKRGDILVSWSASIDAYLWSGPEAWLNQHIFKVLFNKVEVDKSFFYHQMRHILKGSIQLAHGATMRHLTKKAFDNLEFVLPTEEVQVYQANMLNRVDVLIAQLGRHLDLISSLVKSRFVEMFEGEYCSVRLGDYCDRITKGTTPTTAGFSFTEKGVNFIKVESIDERGEFISSKIAHVGLDCHEAFRRSQLEVGDILFSIAGAIGRSAIVTEDILPANTNQALSIIRLSPDAPFDRIFIRHALASSSVGVVTEKLKRGIAQVNLSLKDVSDFVVPMPSMASQREFAAFVAQVDKSELAVRRAIAQLETLKASLMQEYFG